jgi:glycyl-tRNA synthetase
MSSEVTMEKVVSLCKLKGFVFPALRFMGFANTWDYGPYGCQLKKECSRFLVEVFCAGA